MTLKQDYQARYYVPLSSPVVNSTVKQILDLAEKKLGKRRADFTVLDVGSGHGDYTKVIAKFVRRVVGVEPYKEAFNVAVISTKNKNVTYKNKLIEDYNTSQKFDLAVSLTTLEHMPDGESSFKQIYKLMSKNSMLYLTAPNKLWPYDHHYKLPFIAWLPLPIANFYVRVTRRGESYEDSSYSKTFFGVKKLLQKFNWKIEFIVPDAGAEFLACGEERSSWYSLVKNIGISLIRAFPFFWVFSKGFIVVALKK